MGSWKHAAMTCRILGADRSLWLYVRQVVDNSSAFRQTEGVPLIVPEVNPEDMAHVKIGKGAIIANPNCSTIIALMAITPLHRLANVQRMIVSTYQVCCCWCAHPHAVGCCHLGGLAAW